jgi:hypothetical protein
MHHDTKKVEDACTFCSYNTVKWLGIALIQFSFAKRVSISIVFCWQKRNMFTTAGKKNRNALPNIHSCIIVRSNPPNLHKLTLAKLIEKEEKKSNTKGRNVSAIDKKSLKTKQTNDRHGTTHVSLYLSLGRCEVSDGECVIGNHSYRETNSRPLALT